MYTMPMNNMNMNNNLPVPVDRLVQNPPQDPMNQCAVPQIRPTTPQQVIPIWSGAAAFTSTRLIQPLMTGNSPAPIQVFIYNMAANNAWNNDYYYSLVESVAKLTVVYAQTQNMQPQQALEMASQHIVSNITYSNAKTFPMLTQFMNMQDQQRVNEAVNNLEGIRQRCRGFFQTGGVPMMMGQTDFNNGMYNNWNNQNQQNQQYNWIQPDNSQYNQPSNQYNPALARGCMTSTQMYNTQVVTPGSRSQTFVPDAEDQLMTAEHRNPATYIPEQEKPRQVQSDNSSSTSKGGIWVPPSQTEVRPEPQQQSDYLEETADYSLGLPTTPAQQMNDYPPMQTSTDLPFQDTPLENSPELPDMELAEAPVVTIVPRVVKGTDTPLSPDVRDEVLPSLFGGSLPEGSIRVIIDHEGLATWAVPVDQLPEGTEPVYANGTLDVVDRSHYEVYATLTLDFELREVVIKREFPVEYQQHQRRNFNAPFVDVQAEFSNAAKALKSQRRNEIVNDAIAREGKTAVPAIVLEQVVAAESAAFGESRLIANAIKQDASVEDGKTIVVGSYDVLSPIAVKGKVDIEKLKETPLFDANQVDDMVSLISLMGELGEMCNGDNAAMNSKLWWEIEDSATAAINDYLAHTLQVEERIDDFINDFETLCHTLHEKYGQEYVAALIHRPEWLARRILNFVPVSERIAQRFQWEEEVVREATVDEVAASEVKAAEGEEQIEEAEIVSETPVILPPETVVRGPKVLCRVDHYSVALLPWDTDAMNLPKVTKGTCLRVSRATNEALYESAHRVLEFAPHGNYVELVTVDNVRFDVVRSPFNAGVIFFTVK